MDNHLIQNHNTNTKPTPDKLVNLLVDEIIFKECEVKKIEEIIKVCKHIACIEDCRVNVCKVNIYDSRDKNSWIIFVEFKLVICYVSKYGSQNTIEEVIYYEKEIPKPLQVKNHEENYKFVELTPLVFIPRAECIDIDFDNISYFTLITTKIEFAINITVIAKKELLLMSYLPDCDDSTKS